MAEDGKHRSALRANASSNPVPSDHESLIQPGLSLRDYAEELRGELKIPEEPRLSGGYADIYQGQWKRPDGVEVEVAVKVFKQVWPKSVSVDTAVVKERVEKRLRREVSVWTRVKHRNIHPLLGYWSQPSTRLVSAWCFHGNLADYLQSNPDLPRSEKVELTIQAARGLAYLHAQSPPICHADIKPENILVNDLREAVLSDFGLSRLMMELSLSTGLTTSDGPKGTHNYMAPELFEDERPRPTPKSDVFAFGGLLLAVFSGRPPFFGHSPARIMFSVLQGHLPKPDQHQPMETENSLWFLMVKCWTRQPAQRPAMHEVGIELEEGICSSASLPQVSGPPEVNKGSRQADTGYSDTAGESEQDRLLIREAPVVPPPDHDLQGLNYFQSLINQLRSAKITYTMGWNAPEEDPHASPVWVVHITVYDGASGDLVFKGQGVTRRDAREVASLQALQYFGYI